MRRLFILVLATIASAFSVLPVRAQLVRVPAEALSSDDAVFLAQLRTRIEQARTPAEALSVLGDVERTGPMTPRRLLMLDSTAILIAPPDSAEAVAASSRIERIASKLGDDPVAHALLAERSFMGRDIVLTTRHVIATVKADMSWANAFQDYELLVLFDRLKEAEKDELRLQLAKRLFDAGWTKGYAGLRSNLARELAGNFVNAGKLDQARAYILKMEKPTDLYTVLTEKKFAALHEDITAWAGKRLERQWTIYLNQMRTNFRQRGDATSAASLAGALRSAGRYRELSDTILPVAQNAWERERNEAWVPIVVSGASALAEQGQWDKAFKIIDDAEKLIDPTSENRVNFPANRALLRLSKGDLNEAVAILDPLIGEARSNEAVGTSVMTRLLAMRVCARHRMGVAAAQTDASEIDRDWATREPANVSYMWLCLANPDKARKAWLAAAASDDDQKRALLATLQPERNDHFKSKFERDMWEERQLMKNDPRLHAAVEDIGIVLSWPVDSGVSKE